MPKYSKALTGQWNETGRILRGLHKQMDKNMKRATLLNAIQAKDTIKMKITSGDPSWPALSPLTIERKGSSKALISNGDLRNAVNYVKLGSFSFFVGVPGRKSKRGFNLAQLATVMNYGAKILPKKAQMLTIPVSMEASRLAWRHKSVGDIPGLFRPRGTKILATKKGKGKKGFTSMFILMDKVTIPARNFMDTSMTIVKPILMKRWIAAGRLALRGQPYFG